MVPISLGKANQQDYQQFDEVKRIQLSEINWANTTEQIQLGTELILLSVRAFADFSEHARDMQ
jgi:hypothetical protein